MLASALVASLHYLALGLGFCGVFMRGRALGALAKAPTDVDQRAAVLRADVVQVNGQSARTFDFDLDAGGGGALG
jgi:hypothetical protein